MSDDGHSAHGATKKDQDPHKGGHADHSHDHHEDFDPEPAQALSPGEPRTPSWLPVLGGGLFLLGAIWFLASGPSADAAASASAATSAPPTMKAPAAAATGTAAGAPKRPAGLDAERVKAIKDERDRRAALASAKAAASASAGAPKATTSASAGKPAVRP
jgi:hypothetical protein